MGMASLHPSYDLQLLRIVIFRPFAMPRKPWVPKESERRLFHEIYVDETSQNGHHFLVLGGIMIPREYSAEFTADIIEARRPGLHKFTSKGDLCELGWSEISKGDYANYEKVLEAFFSFAARRLVGASGMVKSFCSVVDTRVRGRSYSKGQRGQIGFSREIYFHCISIARNNRLELFHVYPDHRSTKDPIEKMAFMLSSGLKKENDKRDHPFRRVNFRQSHEDQALQISDIIIGAVAYRLNRHYDRPGANEDKKRLCDFILKKTGFDKRIFSDHFRQKTWGPHQLWFRRHRKE
jgi:hypothetical protein